MKRGGKKGCGGWTQTGVVTHQPPAACSTPNAMPQSMPDLPAASWSCTSRTMGPQAWEPLPQSTHHGNNHHPQAWQRHTLRRQILEAISREATVACLRHDGLNAWESIRPQQLCGGEHSIVVVAAHHRGGSDGWQVLATSHLPADAL